MNPLRLKASNLGRFESLDVDIPGGCVALTGPNGAGKSTILNAVEFALFADGSRDLAGCLSPWADRLEIELEFEHAGELYRVRRGYKLGSGGRGSATLDFEHGENFSPFETAPNPNGASWTPLTREKTDATQQLICDTIGMSRRTFNASSFLGQGNAAAFPEASSADRKAMIGEILDPRGLWPALAQRARDEGKALEVSLQVDAGRIAEREQQIAEIPGVAQQLESAAANAKLATEGVEAAEQLLEQAQAAQAANAAAAERVKTAAAERDHAKTAVEQARQAAEKATSAEKLLPEARHTMTELEVAAGLVAALEQARDEQQRAQLEAAAAAERKRQAVENVASLDREVERIRRDGNGLDERHRKSADRLADLRQAPDGTERCDHCQQILGAEARAAAVESLDRELLEIQQEISVKVAALRESTAAAASARAAADAITVPAVHEGDVSADLQAARGAADRLPAQRLLVEGYSELAGQAPALLEQLQTASAALGEKEQALVDASAGVSDETQLARATNDARLRVTTLRGSLTEAQAAVTRLEQRLEQLHTAQTELAESLLKSKESHATLDVLKLAERAFGRDGIPVLLVENVIPQIESEANRILELMPTSDGTVFRVALETQRALKSSDGVRETLDILVADPDGQRAYETFSGGERARLNIALRIALARLLANRRGAESRLLAIDELEYLDELGQENLVDVIRSVAGDFDRCIVVSHSPNVRDAFDSVIAIEKADGVSRIIQQPALEPVPA